MKVIMGRSARPKDIIGQTPLRKATCDEFGVAGNMEVAFRRFGDGTRADRKDIVKLLCEDGANPSQKNW